MNKKAQIPSLMFAIVVAIMIFIIGFMSINFLKPVVTYTRAADQLNCADAANISDGTKLTCLAVDLVIPYFIVIILSIAGGVIAARLTL